MVFGIVIKHERKNISLQVELLESDGNNEKYKVIARNQSFVLQNNRPLLIKRGLKRFPLTWKVIQGGYDNHYILEQIQNAILAKLNTL